MNEELVKRLRDEENWPFINDRTSALLRQAADELESLSAPRPSLATPVAWRTKRPELGHDYWIYYEEEPRYLEHGPVEPLYAAPPSPLAAHRDKVEAEIQDAWERESLSDLCLIARRLLWASHPVPFAGSFGDVVAASAKVKDWGAVPELATPSHRVPQNPRPQERTDRRHDE